MFERFKRSGRNPPHRGGGPPRRPRERHHHRRHERPRAHACGPRASARAVRGLQLGRGVLRLARIRRPRRAARRPARGGWGRGRPDRAVRRRRWPATQTEDRPRRRGSRCWRRWRSPTSAGGYVAGRMSRFDGARQGLGARPLGLVVTVALAVAGAILGSEYNVLERLELPAVPVGDSELATGGALALAVVVSWTPVAAMLGGKVGERYHRRVDRVRSQQADVPAGPTATHGLPASMSCTGAPKSAPGGRTAYRERVLAVHGPPRSTPLGPDRQARRTRTPPARRTDPPRIAPENQSAISQSADRDPPEGPRPSLRDDPPRWDPHGFGSPAPRSVGGSVRGARP